MLAISVMRRLVASASGCGKRRRQPGGRPVRWWFAGCYSRRMALGKSTRAVGPDPAAVQDRSRGALLGLAVGDALGATHEFQRLNAPPFPQLCDGLLRDMKGGGPFHLKPGQVTDDTQMATCLAASLRDLRKFDPEDVAKRYVAWRAAAFDVGGLTGAVLDLIKARQPVATAARDYWIRTGKKSAGNGSLMRTAPIGVFFAKDDQARARASLEDSAITHWDPRCQLACAALNGAIAKAITSMKPPTADTLAEGARSAISIAGALLGQMDSERVREVLDAAQTVRADLNLAREQDPQALRPGAPPPPPRGLRPGRVPAGVLGGVPRAVLRGGAGRRGEPRGRLGHQRRDRRGAARGAPRRGADPRALAEVGDGGAQRRRGGRLLGAVPPAPHAPARRHLTEGFDSPPPVP